MLQDNKLLYCEVFLVNITSISTIFPSSSLDCISLVPIEVVVASLYYGVFVSNFIIGIEVLLIFTMKFTISLLRIGDSSSWMFHHPYT